MKSVIALLIILFLKCPIVDKLKVQDFSGWWIYGESLHLFKDDKSLKEFEISFLNERKEDLELLYLEIAETEYFPVDCNVKGYVKNDTLYVDDFEITFIQGCGED